MSWILIGAIFAAGTIATFTDWLFMGVLFHGAYNRYPEVWRPGIREGKERGAIIWSIVIGYVMSAGVVALCAVAGVGSIAFGLLIGALAFVSGPLVVLVTNGFFMKMDAKITCAHNLGWLVRMLIAGAAAGIALPMG